jgi:hypothetical protein
MPGLRKGRIDLEPGRPWRDVSGSSWLAALIGLGTDDAATCKVIAGVQDWGLLDGRGSVGRRKAHADLGLQLADRQSRRRPLCRAILVASQAAR